MAEPHQRGFQNLRCHMDLPVIDDQWRTQPDRAFACSQQDQPPMKAVVQYGIPSRGIGQVKGDHQPQ